MLSTFEVDAGGAADDGRRWTAACSPQGDNFTVRYNAPDASESTVAIGGGPADGG